MGPAPVEELRPLIPTVPEPAVEHRGEPLFEGSAQFGRETALLDGVGRVAVGARHRLDIFAAAGTALDLENRHARIRHLVEKRDGAQILGRKNVRIVEFQFPARLQIGRPITPATDLIAFAPVGRGAVFVEREETLARNGHAEGAVAEHLELHGATGRSADAFPRHGFADGLHLIETQLAGQHHHVGEPAVETERLEVGNAQLRGDVHLDPELARTGDGRHIGGDHGRDTGVAGGDQGLAHRGQVFVVEGDVERQITA